MVEAYAENPVSHRYTVGKGDSIEITFSDNFGYCLMPHPHLTTGRVLKVRYSVDSAALAMVFSYSVTLERVNLSCIRIGQKRDS